MPEPRPGFRAGPHADSRGSDAYEAGSLVAPFRQVMKYLSLLHFLPFAAMSCGGTSQAPMPAPASDSGAPPDAGPLALSSDGGDAGSARLVDRNMYFTQLVDGFATLEACRAATAGSVFNCEHTLTV